MGFKFKNIFLYTIIIKTRFKSPKPTKQNPKTEPPLKATMNASCNELLAIFETRTFVLTDIHIPIYPEAIDVKAPAMNAKVT